jgi:NAD(P)-dependent dehydrogenase (short-subunit alcohol dehydrogenase family)
MVALQSLNGKIAVVTGATSGIGFRTPAAGHIISDKEGWRFVAAADGNQRKRRD